jgi:DNA-binding beta-propeller fold protein YncE
VAQHGKGKHRGGKGPEMIQLPQGFGPEGITTTKRHTFLVGSRESGAIYKGSLRTGEGDILVPPDDTFRATGMKVDKRGRLFVSGAGSDLIRVFDVRDGDLIESFDVDGAGFINDVILTRRGAYFTDSQVQQLYFIPFERGGELGDLVRIPITGMEYTPGQFNLNGIEAARGGKTLIAVNSFTGELFAIDARAGSAAEIPVTGGDGELDEGDGILLKGRKLYVVENQDNRVTVVKLRRNLSSGRIVREIDSDLFQVPTTIARSGGRNYVVNAKFGSNSPTQSYEVVRVPKK